MFIVVEVGLLFSYDSNGVLNDSRKPSMACSSERLNSALGEIVAGPALARPEGAAILCAIAHGCLCIPPTLSTPATDGCSSCISRKVVAPSADSLAILLALARSTTLHVHTSLCLLLVDLHPRLCWLLHKKQVEHLTSRPTGWNDQVMEDNDRSMDHGEHEDNGEEYGDAAAMLEMEPLMEDSEDGDGNDDNDDEDNENTETKDGSQEGSGNGSDDEEGSEGSGEDEDDDEHVEGLSSNEREILTLMAVDKVDMLCLLTR